MSQAPKPSLLARIRKADLAAHLPARLAARVDAVVVAVAVLATPRWTTRSSDATLNCDAAALSTDRASYRCGKDLPPYERSRMAPSAATARPRSSSPSDESVGTWAMGVNAVSVTSLPVPPT